MIIECDVLVVGAGPAGSVAALYSSKQGLNTILIERNNINQLIGGNYEQGFNR